MPWTCRLVENPTQEDKQTAGVLYHAPWYRESGNLSNQYRRDWADKREPLMLVIPGYGPVCLDSRWSDPQGANGDGWTVTGSAPNVTASPSLGIGSREGGGWWYHGWLKDGVLSDDIDGRKF